MGREGLGDILDRGMGGRGRSRAVAGWRTPGMICDARDWSACMPAAVAPNPPASADAARLLPGVRGTRLVRSARAACRSVGWHRKVCMCRKPLGSIVLAGVVSPVPASAARGFVRFGNVPRSGGRRFVAHVNAETGVVLGFRTLVSLARSCGQTA